MVVADNVAHVGIGLPLALANGSIRQIGLACRRTVHPLSTPVIAACQGVHIIGVHHTVSAIERERQTWHQEVVLLIADAGDERPAAILHAAIHGIHRGTRLHVALIGRGNHTYK